MADSDLYNLEFLSLVAKITQEIDNHTGLSDKTLAEFVISLHDQSNKSLPAFKQKLKEVGADFPDSFIENVDRLILSMHPKHKKKRTTNGTARNDDTVEGELSEQEKKKRLFPGLALQDKPIPKPVSDDVFLQELGDLVSGKKAPRPRPSEDEQERSPKRQRRDYSPRRRSPSPPRGRGYGDRRDEKWSRNGGGRPASDDKPILFKIYNGKVTGLKEFGAFVTLEGVAGRVEGMHFSNYSRSHRLISIIYRHGSRIKYSNGDSSQLRCRPSQPGATGESEGHQRRWESARVVDEGR